LPRIRDGSWPSRACERGEALVDGLLALGLLLFVVALAAQAIVDLTAWELAQAAADDGARAAAAGGLVAGVARASAVLGASGLAVGFVASAAQSGGEVTVTVRGAAPALFPLPFALPAVAATASMPLEPDAGEA
jgi:hypothetical protein